MGETVKEIAMNYPRDYFQEPTARQQRRGIVAEVETKWGVYTIIEKRGKVWIEAYGHGGKERRMPHVNNVEEAKEVVWQQTKPLPKEDIIKF